MSQNSDFRNSAEYISRIKKYVGEIHISVDDHQNSLVENLNKSLNHLKPIYLDLNFWITLRDTVANRGEKVNPSLLDAVRSARSKAFFPIGPTIFSELLKQSDQSKRIEIAELVDELSGGVTARSDAERTNEELHYQFLSMNGKISLRHPSQNIWTRVGHILGTPRMSKAGMPDDVSSAINKIMIDELWSMSSVDWINQTNGMPVGIDMAATAEGMNQLNANAPRPVSYQDAYNQEAGGVVDLYAEHIVNIVAKLPQDPNVPRPPPGHPAFQTLMKYAGNALAHGLRKMDVRANLPSIAIPAALYASVWWDANRKIKPNDVFDFQHAAAAMPYCDAFFTDGPLRTLIVQNPDKLCDMYSCEVISDQSGAINYLRNI